MVEVTQERSISVKDKASMETEARHCSLRVWRRVKPFVFVIAIQVGVAIMTIILKFALNDGMSTFTFVVYRHLLAAIVLAPFALLFERFV